MYPFIIIRWFLATIFIIFLPGYTLIQSLFPYHELSGVVKFILSIALSLMVVIIIGFILHFTEWGIRLNPVVISLTILTLFSTLVGSFRTVEME